MLHALLHALKLVIMAFFGAGVVFQIALGIWGVLFHPELLPDDYNDLRDYFGF
jgi:hypothetical protein